MNKDIIDCIKAEKEKETETKKRNEELVKKIKEFFMDLPEGNYTVKLTYNTTVKQLTKNPELGWFKKPNFYKDIIKEELKELWIAGLGGNWHSVIIQKIDDKIFILKGEYYDYLESGLKKEISNWPDHKVQVFYEHLDWFEQELKKEYCKHHE